jgi:hypothetical protein
MSKKMAAVLFGYGLILAATALTLQLLDPRASQAGVLAGLVGGALAIGWSVVSFLGKTGRTWATLSSVAVGLVVLAEVIHSWSIVAAGSAGNGGGSLLLTLMLVLTIGIIVYLVHGERPAEFYQRRLSGRH